MRAAAEFAASGVWGRGGRWWLRSRCPNVSCIFQITLLHLLLCWEGNITALVLRKNWAVIQLKVKVYMSSEGEDDFGVLKLQYWKRKVHTVPNILSRAFGFIRYPGAVVFKRWTILTALNLVLQHPPESARQRVVRDARTTQLASNSSVRAGARVNMYVHAQGWRTVQQVSCIARPNLRCCAQHKFQGLLSQEASATLRTVAVRSDRIRIPIINGDGRTAVCLPIEIHGSKAP
jgi:hypothetical protein